MPSAAPSAPGNALASGSIAAAAAATQQAAALMRIAIQGNDLDEVIRQADRLLQELRTPGL